MRDSRYRSFQGGTIYNDAAPSLIWVENKVSLGSNDTVVGKSWLEKWLWDQTSSGVSHYHSNNFIFTAS